MINKGTEYLDCLELDVDVEMSNDNFIKGVLKTSNAALPFLVLNNESVYKDPVAHAFHKSPPSFIKCKSKNQVYTLFENKTIRGYITPEYIVAGDGFGGANGVEISLSGLYEFFNGMSSVEYKDNYLRKEVFDNFINIDFTINSEKYNLTVRHDHWGTSKANVTTITEDAVVRVEKYKGVISLKEAKNIIKKVKLLFSLLLGYDLSIKKHGSHPKAKQVCIYSIFTPS